MNAIQKVRDIFTPEFKNEYFIMIKDFSAIVFPQILYFCCTHLQLSINLFFISITYHEGIMLNAVGISHIYANITTSVIFFGISGALDTLASNAYGKKNFRLIGVYFDRCRYISICFFLFIVPFHLIFARSILKLLQVEDSVMDMMIPYILIFVFAQLFQVNFQINSKLFVLIEKSYINLYLSVFALIFHTVFCGFFVYILNLGIKGGSLTFVTTALFNTLASTYVAHRLDLPKETFIYFSKDGLHGWFEYLKIAFPNTLLSLGEWVGFELQAIMSIFISSYAYTINILVLNLETLAFPYTIGISTGIAMKTGDRLMTSSSYELKKFIFVCYSFSFALSIVVLFFFFFFSSTFFYIMAPDETIYLRCCEIIPYLLCYVYCSNGYYVFMNALKGMGYLRNPTVAIFFTFYVVQPILSYLFAFKMKLEVKGIWMSLVIGAFITFLLFFYWVFSFDLEKLKVKAEQRVKNDHKNIINIEMKPIMSTEDLNRERLME